MDILTLLRDKGYLFQADEPGFFMHCADATLGYRTWHADIRSIPKGTKAPFGLIFARKCDTKGAETLFNRLRKNWNELNCAPEVLTLNTSKCNLNCPYCIVGVQEASEFRLPSIEQIENVFKLFPLRRVVVTGGEPLSEKEEFSKILEWLIGKIDRCDVATNGLAWDENLWPLLSKCGSQFDLSMRLSLSESLSHMKLSEFESKILPRAKDNPQVKINLNFLPNHDGSGLLRFLKRVNQLELPAHITVTPSYLTESKLSNSVEFDIGSYLKEMIEVVENEEEYLHNVNIESGNSLGLLTHDLQLLGCKRKTIALSDKGFAICSMFLCEGKIFKGPLEAASYAWGSLVDLCRNCDHYPDRCIEAIQSDQCSKFGSDCNRCPIVYICTLRCPYVFGSQKGKGVCVGDTDLECLGYPLLRIFGYWLMYHNKPWDQVQGETISRENNM
ncbi:MAG TPA: hypothetical protein DDW50_14790 [Firmicutes bacterium]|jgi:hypothetical protein|nr:hypothetical protein [Bacillota bacterium]